MYWADRGPRTVIRKRSVNGRITTHALGDFRAVERMVATPDGTLFLMDAGRLRRVSPNGTVSTVVAALSSKRPTPSEVSSLNYHMGLWLDSQHQVYVAAAAEGLVLRVSDRGEVVVATRSVAPWAPSGGLIDREGRLWVLEYDTANAVRVRRVDRDGRERIFVPAR